MSRFFIISLTGLFWCPALESVKFSTGTMGTSLSVGQWILMPALEALWMATFEIYLTSIVPEAPNSAIWVDIPNLSHNISSPLGFHSLHSFSWTEASIPYPPFVAGRTLWSVQVCTIFVLAITY